MKKSDLHIANNYINVKALFPKSNIDLRRTPTPYQARKINAAMKSLAELAGGVSHLKNDFIKVKRNKPMRDYMSKAGIPPYSRGVLIAGGAKVNSEVKAVKGLLFFKRGDLQVGQYPLDGRSVEIFKADLERHRPLLISKGYKAALATFGGEIKNGGMRRHRKYITDRQPYIDEAREKPEVDTDEDEAFDLFVDKALGVYELYKGMYERGETRSNGRKAACPSRWGLSIWLEKKPEPKKTKPKKRSKAK